MKVISILLAGRVEVDEAAIGFGEEGRASCSDNRGGLLEVELAGSPRGGRGSWDVFDPSDRAENAGSSN